MCPCKFVNMYSVNLSIIPYVSQDVFMIHIIHPARLLIRTVAYLTELCGLRDGTWAPVNVTLSIHLSELIRSTYA